MLENDNGTLEPKPCARTQGTQIIIEDLFYNSTQRQKALKKSTNEEYSRIVDVTMKYALHNFGVAFNLKKLGDSKSDVSTKKCLTILDTVKILYGTKILKDIISIEIDEEPLSKCKATCLFTSLEYTSKKTTFILFINNRLVDCAPLKKVLESQYRQVAGKAVKPWMYISLQIDPHHVDVNIHPTKSEVRFLYQDEIIASVADALLKELVKANEGKTFTSSQVLATQESFLYEKPSTPGKTTPSSPWSNVRNDSRDQKINSFFNTQQSVESEYDSPYVSKAQPESENDSPYVSKAQSKRSYSEIPSDNQPALYSNPSKMSYVSSLSMQPRTYNRDLENLRSTSISSQIQNKIRPTSITTLIQDCEKENHVGIQSILKNHVFVGCVNTKLSLIQEDTKLYLCDMHTISKELIYQKCLLKFSQFEPIRISSPLSIFSLCKLALESPDSGWDPTDGDPDQIAKAVVDNLMRKQEMLKENFSIEIDDEGRLCSLPEILDDLVPPIDGLASFILKLSTDVDWNGEMSCFDSLSRELSEYYSIPNSTKDVDEESSRNIEHIYFPALKLYSFYPPRIFSADETIVQIASLDKLYKVFERC